MNTDGRVQVAIRCAHDGGSGPAGRQTCDVYALRIDHMVAHDLAGGIATLLNRNLPEVFGEGDPVRRKAAIQELYTDDCVLYVPPGALVGHDALDKFAGELRATHPHFAHTPHGVPQVLHNSGRLAWGSGPKGEAPVYTGVDFIIVRDGKIAALYV